VPDERIEAMMDVPVDRRNLVRWLMTFHPESIEELRDSLLMRLDDGAFTPSSYPRVELPHRIPE